MLGKIISINKFYLSLICRTLQVRTELCKAAEATSRPHLESQHHRTYLSIQYRRNQTIYRRKRHSIQTFLWKRTRRSDRFEGLLRCWPPQEPQKHLVGPPRQLDGGRKSICDVGRSEVRLQQAPDSHWGRDRRPNEAPCECLNLWFDRSSSWLWPIDERKGKPTGGARKENPKSRGQT